MSSLITTVLFYISGFLLPYNSMMAHSIAFSSQRAFATELHSIIAENKSTENICYSPASIYTSLALIYLGATGNTAAELYKVLKLQEEQVDKTTFAVQYGKFLQTAFPKIALNDEALQLKTATRLYVNSEIKISQQFNKLAQDNLQCEAENVDFGEGLTVVEKINKWVEEKTANKITNLLQLDAVNDDTSAILINAIYFRAKWLKPFSLSSTSKNDFHINRNEKVNVDMMYTEDNFGYAELPDLRAKALEMHYRNSNISMLIILPDDIEGLETLEKKLKQVDLSDLTKNLRIESVNLFLPRFRIEVDIDLKEHLAKMGCPSMFAQNANLSGLFDSPIPQRISAVKHKAFLDCNEAGSEAAAATYLKIVPMSLIFDQKVFRANHPFLFFVRSKDAVYFSGHLAIF